MKGSRFLQSYIIPICVYQSVAIAGGYGTGREVVEYFTSHGSRNGFFGLLAAAIVLAVITALTFEFARVVRAYDYRTFFRALIGRYWIGFEACYIILFLIAIAVVASAAGTLLSAQIGISEKLGLLMMLCIIGILAFYGREIVERTMVFLALLLFTAFAFYFVAVLTNNNEVITQSNFEPGSLAHSSWLGPALTFAFYSSPIAPCVLFATRGISRRSDAFACGTLCGLILMVPGFLFHMSFLGVMPEVLDQKVPVYWLIEQLNMSMLMPVYLIAMLGTFVGTATGFIQAVNERLDCWAKERSGKALSPWIHTGVAVGGFVISAALGQYGIIALIARGYGAVAWGFLLFFVLPILTIGVHRIFFRQETASA